ncbi:MAG: hypothetical protein WA081_10835 [Desulfosalsimonadaceae bacterium]
MKPFFTLIDIFIRQMIRSKALWVMTGMMALMILINFYFQSQFDDWMKGGMTYDMATRKATGALTSMAQEIRTYASIFIIIIAAVIAPESRKNGTTQFVLSLQVSRLKLAAAQFIALTLFIVAAVLVIHSGFSVFALKMGFIGIPEVLLSWILLLIPLLLAAAVSFSLSLTFSTAVVYILVFAVPLILIELLDTLIRWKGQWIPVPVAHIVDNLNFLFIHPESIIFWPFLSPNLSVSDAPYPVWHWFLLNNFFAAGFWVMIGYLFYRNYNIGSRLPSK